MIRIYKRLFLDKSRRLSKMKCYGLFKKEDGKEEILKIANPVGEVFEFKFKTFKEAEEFLKFMPETDIYIKEIEENM